MSIDLFQSRPKNPQGIAGFVLQQMRKIETLHGYNRVNAEEQQSGYVLTDNIFYLPTLHLLHQDETINFHDKPNQLIKLENPTVITLQKNYLLLEVLRRY